MKFLEFVRGLPRSAGTTVYVVEMVRRLVVLGHEVTVAVEPIPHSLDAELFPPGVRLLDVGQILYARGDVVVRYRDRPGETFSEPIDCLSGRPFDFVHVHGMWSPVLRSVASWSCRRGIHLIWSPHGMLTPWALGQHRLAKRYLWWRWQRKALSSARYIHVTSAAEREDVSRLGVDVPCIESPLGVDMVYTREQIKNIKAQSRRETGLRTILFLSRVQKKKGLLNLVEAWKVVRRPGWRIVIAGPDEGGYWQVVRRRIEELGLTSDMLYVGEVSGDRKNRLYASADVFVLPTFSENFGSVVIESLANGTPVITTKGAPWSELETRRCGWWIDLGVGPLAETLARMMAMSDMERDAMGSRGFEWVASRYAWTGIIRRFVCEIENGETLVERDGGREI